MRNFWQFCIISIFSLQSNFAFSQIDSVNRVRNDDCMESQGEQFGNFPREFFIVVGEVKAIRPDSFKMSIASGCIDHIGLPPMELTYQFESKQSFLNAIQSGVRVGSKIRFLPKRVQGRYFIDLMEKL